MKLMSKPLTFNSWRQDLNFISPLEIPKTSQTVVLHNINIYPIHTYIASKTVDLQKDRESDQLEQFTSFWLSHQPLQLDFYSQLLP